LNIVNSNAKHQEHSLYIQIELKIGLIKLILLFNNPKDLKK